MKINVNAEINGEEIVKIFLDVLLKQGITGKSEEIKFLVQSKEGKEVEITSDRLKVVFNR